MIVGADERFTQDSECNLITLSDLKRRDEKISVIGLGYVGIPLAVAFSKKVNVIGYDNSVETIDRYGQGVDPTKEVGDDTVRNSGIEFTHNESRLKESKFHIVAVPTPVTKDNIPDLSFVKNASEIVGRNLVRGSIVVFESTVYPGVTEEICIPILEHYSGMKCGADFGVGYSPERINPGDKERRLENIVKVVSGMNKEVLDTVSEVYAMVITAGVFQAESIKVAEAAKIIENSQRDINIAFMNELSIIFDKMNIDMKAVLETAETKWNFLKFYPGLVGGHCVGVDPYYLAYRAGQLGHVSQVILSGRQVNDGMGKYIANSLIKLMIKSDIAVKDSYVAVLGFTFKENCSDARNTKVIDIIHELREYCVNIVVSDPLCEATVAQNYGVDLRDIQDVKNVDVVIIAVAHDSYRNFAESDIEKLYKTSSNKSKILIDVKGILSKENFASNNYVYWRL